MYWQSFDHPTDTWLPGAKLGIDKRTGKIQLLTSWKNPDDPSPGLFSVGIDPGGSNEYVMKWNMSTRYWSSGVWQGQFFNFVPELSHTYRFNFFSDENETYFTYSLFNPVIVSRLVVTMSGQLNQQVCHRDLWSWESIFVQPKEPAYCGPFGISSKNLLTFCKCLQGFEPYSTENTRLDQWSYSCVRRAPLQCEDNPPSKGNRDGFLHIPDVKLPADPTPYPAQSLKTCKSACMQNCSCKACAYSSTGCSMWFGALLNMQELRINDNNKQDIYLKLAASELPGKAQKSRLRIIVEQAQSFGGQELAVKRLSKRSGQGLEEFRNEIGLISKLQHRNLVRVLGCCIEQDEKLLIYEYMPNKSLDSFIFEGIAQGLLYLHQYSRFRIIHRDLKASNILLDGEMNPKISDFGMARIFGGNESEANTNRVVGTFGYMAPEYAMEGLFSVKSDVFSFGVLLLEIVSGKKNTGFYNKDPLNLLGHAWGMWNADRALELIDSVLVHPSSASTLLRYINIGLLCVQENPSDRPTMSDIVSMLSNDLAALPTPKQPAFCTSRSVMKANSSANSTGNCSVNGLTISRIEPR
ncbi:hypothetical protein RJ640_024516 [Escallonia rubra]|uniref:non-specific serine/threonine protein kinase n=1 Tax=Escallonia rubra TaxID=112253 RepID=A0AA88RS42_9ASTE|nr:hypothetical protein RJ640_024516 [Escallonia rubra]